MYQIFVIMFLLCSLSSISHAEKKPVAAGVPPELKKMLDQFSQAVSKNDKKKASELSFFPLKNIVYQDKKTTNQKEFESSLKQRMQAFCYGSQMPEIDKNGKDWVLDCDGNVFYFGVRSGQWKYLGYENINE